MVRSTCGSRHCSVDLVVVRMGGYGPSVEVPVGTRTIKGGLSSRKNSILSSFPFLLS